MATWSQWCSGGPGARRILDLGCGDGTLCRILKAAGPDVAGCDANRKGIELVRAKSPVGFAPHAVVGRWAYQVLVAYDANRTARAWGLSGDRIHGRGEGSAAVEEYGARGPKVLIGLGPVDLAASGPLLRVRSRSDKRGRGIRPRPRRSHGE
jgi:hypothetical protein